MVCGHATRIWGGTPLIEDLSRLGSKITLVLFFEQGLASAAFIAASTLNAIVAADLAGNVSVAGVPAAAYLLSGAFAAGGWGILNDALGRRSSLVLGLIIGAVGSGMAFYAIAVRSFPGFLLGMLLMGVANAAVQLARFIAADVNVPEARGRAISQVVLGGTVGSVVGPLVTGPAGQFFRSFAGNELAGAYAISMLLFLLGAAVIFVGLRPDPRQIGRDLVSSLSAVKAGLRTDAVHDHRPVRSASEILRQPAAAVAATSMVVGQLVMVLVMVITSLHMKGSSSRAGRYSHRHLGAHFWDVCVLGVFRAISRPLGPGPSHPDGRLDACAGLPGGHHLAGRASAGRGALPAGAGMELLLRRAGRRFWRTSSRLESEPELRD